VDVSRVAREKYPAMAIVRDLTLVAVESRQPADLDDARVPPHRPGQHVDDLCRRRRIAIRCLMLAVPHHRAVPGAFVVVTVVRREEAEDVASTAQRQAPHGRSVAQLHVGKHHRRQDRLAGGLDADEAADCAVCAIRAYDIGGAPGRLGVRVVPTTGGDGHAVGVLIEPHHLDSTADVGTGRGGIAPECPVHCGLRSDHCELVART
jgi:hypothetical protein